MNTALPFFHVLRMLSPRSRRWITGALLLATLPGCSRQFWRRQADMDVYEAESQKLMDPRWAVPRVDITPDQRSRFFDPYDPDKPPLPPDDPFAHQYMHCVDGWEGYKGWHGFGDTATVENPQWLANFGITPEMIDPVTGQYTAALPALKGLTLQQAVELSLIHSRDYQTQLENVYLAALQVTFQRFQFGVRYLGTVGEPSAGLTTVVSPDGTTANDRTIGSTRFGISQVLPSGAQWIVELSNNTIWLFGGGGSTNTASLLAYQITQPLFFGAGRKVVLEALTQAERNLLYVIRDLARFRQQLFTDVVATNGAISYLGLLQSRQQIINQEENLRRLQQQVFKLQTNAERGRIVPSAFLPAVNDAVPPYLQEIPEQLRGLLFYDLAAQRLRWRSETTMTPEQSTAIRGLSDDEDFQLAVTDLVRQVRDPVNSLDVLQILSQYNQQENTLRNLERNFQDNLDSYKIELGLPPTIPVTLDVSLLDQFQLIAPQILELENEVDQKFSAAWASAAGVPDPNGVESDLYDLEKVRSVAKQFDELVKRVRVDVASRLESEVGTVAEMVPQRLQELSDEDDRRRLQIDFDRDRRVFNFSVKDFESIESQVAELEEQLALSRVENSALQAAHIRIKEAQESLVRFVRTMTVLEVGLRAEMIRVNAFDMIEERCLELALQNRVDLMNARGDVMDSRRLVEIAANRLQAALALTAEGDFGTSNSRNPLSFDEDNAEFRFGVQFRAPLDQIAERNAYRTSLINYQRARRSYMLFEDQVKQQVRRALRGMIVQEKNLETARGAVRRAALQYDALNEQTDDPARAAQAANSTTGGLQGNNVLTALNSILNAQNQLISSWVDYERNRLNIYRDMGIMDIGPDGLWNDPFYRSSPNDPALEVTPNPLSLPTPAGPRPDPGDDGSGFGRSIDAPRLDLPEVPEPR
ncbi:Outer membrane efflux protein [Caulifigura coniformis]|uniref:Outer membrane efflux protein n=1 Tax=Caulifigura coniformis TaxID=2527983 RepID=A0A517SL73_9PLAN|nr:TolC family protein [Caulifigura coniformis]QDT56862.1 Outer membrane efflux protein [Caulifigura coniformis]